MLMLKRLCLVDLYYSLMQHKQHEMCETIASVIKHLDCLLKNRGYISFLASFLLLNHSFLLGWLVELS